MKTDDDTIPITEQDLALLLKRLNDAEYRAGLLTFLQDEGLAMKDDWIEGHRQRCNDKRAL